MTLRKKVAAVAAAVAAVAPALFPAGSAATAANAATPVALVAPGASWRYLNGTSAPAAGWKGGSWFSDSAWKTGTGVLGWQNPVTTKIGVPNRTVYFRSTFTAPDPATLSGASLSLRVDDGAVVYLNGREIARSNMPAGVPSWSTFASRVDPYDGAKKIAVAVPVSALVTGRNVLSVELHQAGSRWWTSSDATMAATLTATAKPVNPLPTQPSGWQPYWSDEFSGSALDPSKWNVHNDDYGWMDPYSQHCMKPANVTLAGGTLTLTAKRQLITCPSGRTYKYTSGMVDTAVAGTYFPRYGRWEIRAKVPHGQGMWPGLWLRHFTEAVNGEVDILEFFHSANPGRVSQTLHFPSTIGANIASARTWVETPTQARGGWHTYVVVITQAVPGSDAAIRFVMSVDGVKTFDYVLTDPAAIAKIANAPFDKTWDFAANLYVGGTWAGDPEKNLGYLPARGGICSLTARAPAGGDPANCPKTGIFFTNWSDPSFELDYVRVWVPATTS